MAMRQNIRTICPVAAILSLFIPVIFGCRVLQLDFEKCTASLDPYTSIIYVPAGIILSMYFLVSFYKKIRSSKSDITCAATVMILSMGLSFVLSQIPAIKYDMIMFSFTLIILWVSLLVAFGTLKKSLLGWIMFTGFLVYLMISVPDNLVLFSFICALFTCGAALYKTGVKKLAEYTALGTCSIIGISIVIMGIMAVLEQGMPPPGYEWLILPEALGRTAPHADSIIIAVTIFIGAPPLVFPFLKRQ